MKKKMKDQIGHKMAPKDKPQKMMELEILFSRIMQVLGLKTDHPDCKDTPHRLAKMYANELFAGLDDPDFKITVFPNSEKYNEMVIVKDIEMNSVCAHHWQPFIGTVDIGYLPDKHYVGLSKFARVSDHFAKRPQVQERLTTQIAEFLWETLKPKGLIVVVKAAHMCMSCRGVKKHNSVTVTSCIKGKLDKMEFLELCKKN